MLSAKKWPSPISGPASITGDWRGLRTSLEERGVTLTLKHEAETWASGFGGLQTGTIYNGLTTASLSCEMRARSTQAFTR